MQLLTNKKCITFPFYTCSEVHVRVTCGYELDVAGYDFPLFPPLNQLSFHIFFPIWSELDEQASLVLQESSSYRMLFSPYSAVCGFTGYTRCVL